MAKMPPTAPPTGACQSALFSLRATTAAGREQRGQPWECLVRSVRPTVIDSQRIILFGVWRTTIMVKIVETDFQNAPLATPHSMLVVWAQVDQDCTQSLSFLVHSNWETGASERQSRARGRLSRSAPVSRLLQPLNYQEKRKGLRAV